MKKTIILIILAGAILGALSTKEEVVLIPKDAIRFRVIASSNNETDQNLKKKVASNLKKEITSSLKPTLTLEKTRQSLKGNLPSFQENIKKTLKKNHSDTSFKIDYGKHYFPEKTYKGVVYEAGEYESLVVTLGKGKGENFWCVLFPPLCLLEAEEENTNDVEYKSFVKEVIDKYFHSH